MKNFSKTFILLLGIAVAITAGIYLARVISDDVPQAEIVDVYPEFCSEQIADYEANAGEKVFINYNKIRNLDSILYAEGLIGADLHGENMCKIVEIFAPHFSNYSYNIFDRSSWPSGELAYIQAYAKQIVNLKTPDGTPALSNSEQIENANFIIDLIDRYNQAWKDSEAVRFYSFKDTQEKFKKINEYQKDPYLKNVTSLQESLNDTKQAICNNHYYHIDNLCDKFLNKNFNYYKKKDLPQFNDEAQTVFKEIENYQTASIYSGLNRKDLNEKKRRVEDRYNSLYNEIKNRN